MNIFLSYILLGLSLAAPIGPVNAAQIDRGIRNGFRHSLYVGVGAILADAIYMLIVYIGVVRFVETDLMKTFLWSFGSFVLIYTGIESLIQAGEVSIEQRQKKEPLLKSFLSGFFMSISNPLTVLFWLGIYGAILAKTASNYKSSLLILYSIGVFIGLLLWNFTMAGISSSFKKYLTPKLLTNVSFLSGLSLIVFGIYFGIQALNILIG